MELTAGSRLAHYELVEKIGEGGMGLVWRAVDTTLNREVAIKLLPQAFGEDPDRLARFEREARLLASVNHPNIAAIYGVHQDAGHRFLAIELVPGEDLGELLRRGPLPWREAVPIARQITLALEEAHERGIVHRDLKPANIRIVPDGTVKVLDFGVAKALDANAVDSGVTQMPTMTSLPTAAGVIVGTAPYMSPEQARGRPIDRRTDIWAFGCVLFEMLTGRVAFHGETMSDTIAKIIEREPSINQLPAETPRALLRLIERCLIKDAQRRLRDIGEARIALEDVAENPSGDSDVSAAGVASKGVAKTAWLPWALAALMALFAAAAFWSGRQTETPAPQLDIRFSVFPEGSAAIPVSDESVMSLSPDGGTLAFVSRTQDNLSLNLRRLDSLETLELPETEGATSPFFSPDGQWIGFFADGHLLKVPAAGGRPVLIADTGALARGAVWMEDGTIILSPTYQSGLERVPATGGKLEPLTHLENETGDRTHRWPDEIPGKRAVIFTVGTRDQPGNYDDARIDLYSIDTGERKTLIEGASMARYSPTGHLIYARARVLWAVPFDLDRLEVTGAAQQVIQGVSGESSSGICYFAVSRNGTLAYVPGSLKLPNSRLAWFDREGHLELLAAPPRPYFYPRLSPDGTRVTVGIGTGRGASDDVWTYDIARGALSRITFDQQTVGPIWTPDGLNIAYGTVSAGIQGAVLRPADGSGEARVFSELDLPAIPSSWLHDGSVALTTIIQADTGTDIWLLDAKDSSREKALIASPFHEWGAQFSPNGHWFAYVTDESGRQEVYVTSYPEMSRKWQVSANGGHSVTWSRDGRELFYINGRQMFVARTGPGPEFSPEAPQLLFTADFEAPVIWETNFDVSADGRRFLMTVKEDPDSERAHIAVVLNWSPERPNG